MPKPISTGTVCDGFLVGEGLLRGGMATIYEVTKPGYDLPMIMKVPHWGHGDDAASIVGFEVEKMILPKLTGIHVPRFIASGEHDTCPYIVMEYVKGMSLRHYFNVAPLTIDQVQRIGIKVATALHDLHQQRVVHMDLKPSNIIFRESGEACLIDFGFSQHQDLPDLLKEEIHEPLGTAPYISPEQIFFHRGDPRSDIFALGAILYALITGTRPFGFPTSVAGLKRRLYEDPKPPRLLRAETPKWLQEIVLRCLEVEPTNRYGSAAQLAFDLSNPEQVYISSRGKKVYPDPWWAVLRRRFVSFTYEPEKTETAQLQLSRAPIMMVAIDIEGSSEDLLLSLKESIQRLSKEKDYRIAIVSVLKISRLGLDASSDEKGKSYHLKKLSEIKGWSKNLQVNEANVTYHVLEASDPATAIVDYIRHNNVDHVIIGARGSSMMRRFLGSVSSRVVSEAPCTVTVVRTPRQEIQSST